MIVPGNKVLEWYQYNVSLSVRLIESFIQDIEAQAKELINRYEAKKIDMEEVGYDLGGEIRSSIEIYQGLDSETWDLPDMFREYFPSLQRRSALLTVCGYFEHELDKLCLLYKSEKGFKLSLSDLNGKGIDRAINYLEKVACLDVCRVSREWGHIKNIQKIRNLIVHQDGKLIDREGKPIKDVIDYVEQADSLSGEDEIIIGEGFLSHVVDNYKKYFKLLNKSIKNL